MADDPTHRWDRLDTLKAQIAGAARSVARAGYDGALDPAWSERIAQALARALRECERARAAGAVLRVCPPPAGASVEVFGPVVQPLPTEPAHASDDGWAGL